MNMKLMTDGHKGVYANYARDLNFSHRSFPTDIKDMMR